MTKRDLIAIYLTFLLFTMYNVNISNTQSCSHQTSYYRADHEKEDTGKHYIIVNDARP